MDQTRLEKIIQNRLALPEDEFKTIRENPKNHSSSSASPTVRYVTKPGSPLQSFTLLCSFIQPRTFLSLDHAVFRGLPIRVRPLAECSGYPNPALDATADT